MISQAEAEKAWEYLRNTAKEAAKKEAERGHVEDYQRVVKANVMSEHMELPVNAQEREAHKSVEYIAHLDVVKFAREQDIEIQYLREAARLRISMWQTQSKLAGGI
jgi:tRNA A37 N6-isopentenylltransferase MiaA